VTPFKDKYQRNNKQTGRKNLRCFPTCHPVKHMPTGFCGQPVKIVLENCQYSPNKLRVWGQFETVGSPPDVKVNESIPEREATKKERCRQYPMLPWLRGCVYAGLVDFDSDGFEILERGKNKRENSGKATVMINSERMGWHYQWASNKHTCDHYHVLRVYIFSVDSSNDSLIKCVGVYSSPEFQIFCRRRLRKPKVGPASVVKRERNGFTYRPPEASSVLLENRKRNIEYDGDEMKKKTPKLNNGNSLGNGKLLMNESTFLKLMEHLCFNKAGGDQATIESSASSMEDFSSNLLGGILYGLDMTPANEGDAEQKVSHKSISSDLTDFLLQEKSFTGAISGFFQRHALTELDESSLQDLFTQFTNIVQDHVVGFLENRGMSMEDFVKQMDKESETLSSETNLRLLGSDPNKRFNSFKIQFLRRLRQETCPKAFPVDTKPVHPDFDINGTWLNTGQTELEYEHAQRCLAERGYPIFVFRIIRVMMWRFRITISSENVLIQGEKKLMHNAEFLFKLDNHDHPFEIPHVVPLGMPTIPCMYRAYCTTENDVNTFRCIIHGFFPRLPGVRFEIVRSVHIKDNRQILHTFTDFDIIRSTGVRENICGFRQKFFKTSGGEEYNDLLDYADDILHALQ